MGGEGAGGACSKTGIEPVPETFSRPRSAALDRRTKTLNLRGNIAASSPASVRRPARGSEVRAVPVTEAGARLRPIRASVQGM
ncbi:hypothetical protein Skr01_28940 [Sphaerisporangium krabiense]|nr:hypothetical protein Skr01_28940 [Sphaerisporangium krabiense]